MYIIICVCVCVYVYVQSLLKMCQCTKHSVILLGAGLYPAALVSKGETDTVSFLLLMDNNNQSLQALM